jgi:hypothetical protein
MIIENNDYYFFSDQTYNSSTSKINSFINMIIFNQYQKNSYNLLHGIPFKFL